MMLEPNLFFVDKKKKIDVRGYHDPASKRLTLMPGSSGTICGNPKNIFFSCPNILAIYVSDLLSCISSTGDDCHFYIQKELHCYPTDNRDELSVAASLMAGELTRGDKVWKNGNGDNQQKQKLFAVSPVSETSPTMSPEDVARFEDATQKTVEKITRPLMIAILSLGYHLKTYVGTKKEDRFTVPRQIDHCMEEFGFQCVEEDAYDLIIPEFGYTISDKMGNDLFHTEKRKKIRPSKLGSKIQMSNTRPGQDSNDHLRPEFDCLMVMQYIPYLVCGVVPYHKIVTHFRPSSGGWTLENIPVDYFKYVISPSESIKPIEVSHGIKDDMGHFARENHGAFLKRQLDKMPKIVDNSVLVTDAW